MDIPDIKKKVFFKGGGSLGKQWLIRVLFAISKTYPGNKCFKHGEISHSMVTRCADKKGSAIGALKKDRK